MFFTNLVIFSSLINYQNIQFTINNEYNYDLIKIQDNVNTSNNIETNKIGIIDFRFILKKSNAMKVLGNKFLSLEKQINDKIKQKQISFKKKEERIKKSKSELSEAEYKEKIKLFKAEVFQTQKKYKEEKRL